MPKTVLVLNDSRSVLVVIGTTLKVAGYNVIQASDGQEGLDVLNGGENIDMIITDLKYAEYGWHHIHSGDQKTCRF